MTARGTAVRRRRSTVAQRGQVLVIFALALTGLMAATGLAVDIGRFYAERRFLQNAADAAALGIAGKMTFGDGKSAARVEGVAILARHYEMPPNGLQPNLPPAEGSEVYESGHAGDVSYMVDGINITENYIRVAVRNLIPYTFGRAVGLHDQWIVARARVLFNGALLPIAVRNYVNAPGLNTGTSPCVDNQAKFMDFFATANTSCLGTETSDGQRVDPTTGLRFNSVNPDDDRNHHGPIVEILGQGAQPGNGSDFRGFVALDIRNFVNASSQIYYNDVPSGVSAPVLKDLAARWIYTAGYPGPKLHEIETPPSTEDQLGLLTGNSTGSAIDAVQRRFRAGDPVLILVYSGLTQQIPDFTMNGLLAWTFPPTGAAVSNWGAVKIARNQAFAGQVQMSTVADALDPVNPMVTGTMLGGANPFTYSPNPVTPGSGGGTSVYISGGATAGAPAGVYLLWLSGEAGSPYLTRKYFPMAITIESGCPTKSPWPATCVSKDFTLGPPKTNGMGNEMLAPTLGSSGTLPLNLQAVNPHNNTQVYAFNGTGGVTLSLEAYPGETLPAGLGPYSFSQNPVVPGTTNAGTNFSLTVNSGSLREGQYPMVVRATGTNSDGQKVTHVFPILFDVVTGASNSNNTYVDVTGYAVMRITQITSNTVYAYAITPAVTNIRDSRLRLGQVARLTSW